MNAFSEIIEILQPHTESPILNPPATPSEIAEVEDVVGRRLPDDVRSAYELGNGEPGRDHYEGIFAGEEFLSTQEVIGEYIEYIKLLDDVYREDSFNDTVSNIVPPDTVKQEIFNRNWIPIAGKGSAHLSVDFDPGPKGVKGQLIYHDGGTPAYFQLGTSFSDFCQFLLARYKKHEMHRWLLKKGVDETDEELFNKLYRMHQLQPPLSKY